MQRSLVPQWIQHAASREPGQLGGRGRARAVLPGTDWGMVLTHRLGLLAVLTGICVALATRAFGAYQRAV